jgi:hypothetical protein
MWHCHSFWHGFTKTVHQSRGSLESPKAKEEFGVEGMMCELSESPPNNKTWRRILFLLVCLILSLFWTWETSAPAGIPSYPGTASPLVSLLFPIVRDKFVEIHYVPLLRVAPEGIFVTTQETVREIPHNPVSLTVVNPLNIAQHDAKISREDPLLGLVLLKAPFRGPVYRLAKRLPREGEKVILAGSPPKKMSHMIPIEHRVPDLRPLRLKGEISGNNEVIGDFPPSGIPAGWAVLGEGGEILLGLVVTSKKDKAIYVSTLNIIEFLKGVSVQTP